MKKLNLKKLKLNADNLLQRDQLKSVFGGYGDGTCTRYVAKCYIPGESWIGSTNDQSVVQDMLTHCNNSGGTMDLQINTC
ncbi:hypothetical protein [Flavivirga rizhaonensis]|uniref:Uncharacterized protein n=1 Tax=Flavivirga rizhaonensis TaxID=2559571 RepID=A0A4V3P4X7_9FLAO|nr:hypothetical protein [Flavivirga rizhaonensis]TGV03104.1 hypothetical protein EM932_07255 [Flavivirga rizhaonensis]